MGGITLTIITHKASSLNYGETVGNVSILKKVTLGDGTQKTFVSDKALKYDMRRKGKEEKGWKLLDELLKEYIEKSQKDGKLDVDEFGRNLVENYEEFDLFGGLFTNLKDKKNKEVSLSYGDSVKRVCAVKVTYAFSVSDFKGDMNFLNNIDAYNRYIKHIEGKKAQAIAQTEEHTSHYVYTITIDLDRVGVWEKEDGTREPILDPQKRAKRVKDLLDIVMTLNRQIKGRWENLSPVFVVGGLFGTKHPFFMNAVDASEMNGRLFLQIDRLRDAIDMVPENERSKVKIGMLSGIFINEEDIKSKLQAKSIGELFRELKQEVDNYYGVSEG
ncbi:CRISPR-associated autoregulator, DevR family [Thermocrinis albus DSM 14484]|uniref:CRISPR-associated autoregulator, DevR family n=1 Tax=Thermocrinis albus (strain DSM 14484 / JCM 11386 / HI 11/12) TaxID=638303 RepID=D3SNB4_THEAH|nr:type I-B CRISPR-associated protein Cas7/Cst2/DevR [Thermocrinis albus]ADC88651.1 CRISPR-associated autoregulator, DevR family [Thermocrinis albus DSM 14484]